MFLRLPQQGGEPRQVAEVVNRILDGKINSTGNLSFNTASVPLTVYDARCGQDSVILLMPMNEDSTKILTHLYFSTVANGSFVLSLRTGHSSADALFRYVVLG